ncbi:hypothetical protein MJO28_016839 [Puccinia striiformis f. sp. tritici]|uniref:Uncharacterized protein n=1 Tax=Puccinia striiformis f. sp. tritici PST-78 TaxID=1165861 RepID=A0A0L0UQX1_9BASI|nr:hypothetical protein Pst134EA_002692 [Puccinia striiformis f. sp. tritici]KAH9472066.1 hypothetical protein Pst134EA_002692 [Puccinia striiformis f. sp. tritici]KAI7935201.1 hypothetical protein MJO28_016839 [Puccinia striiformis f. sp. tritici]KNE89370.1 hypothetical protein PSTG_17170 [Puccinia striiformis f. sp. tritici PST-78]
MSLPHHKVNHPSNADSDAMLDHIAFSEQHLIINAGVVNQRPTSESNINASPLGTQQEHAEGQTSLDPVIQSTPPSPSAAILAAPLLPPIISGSVTANPKPLPSDGPQDSRSADPGLNAMEAESIAARLRGHTICFLNSVNHIVGNALDHRTKPHSNSSRLPITDSSDAAVDKEEIWALLARLEGRGSQKNTKQANSVIPKTVNIESWMPPILAKIQNHYAKDERTSPVSLAARLREHIFRFLNSVEHIVGTALDQRTEPHSNSSRLPITDSSDAAVHKEEIWALLARLEGRGSQNNTKQANSVIPKAVNIDSWMPAILTQIQNHYTTNKRSSPVGIVALWEPARLNQRMSEIVRSYDPHSNAFQPRSEAPTTSDQPMLNIEKPPVNRSSNDITLLEVNLNKTKPSPAQDSSMKPVGPPKRSSSCEAGESKSHKRIKF